MKSLEQKCNFCKKSRSQVKKLFQSTVDEEKFICGRCVVSLKKRMDIELNPTKPTVV